MAYQKAIGKTVNRRLIYPKTIGQWYLSRCMYNSEIVFTTEAAGTGKTYPTVVCVADLLKKGEIRRTILTRPAVETRENSGFLSSDLKEKMDPYLRPLYDTPCDTLGQKQVEKLLKKEVTEIVPFAYMRGRTLDNTSIVLDEVQNTTRAQMRMFLTRMGFHSRIVIIGGITQADLIKEHGPGLLNARHLLSGIESIPFVELTNFGVIRSPLIQRIIERYE